MIRSASQDDADALVAIYNHYVLETTTTFEEEPIEPLEMRERVRRVTATLPWLLYESGGEVLGYSYASQWSERAAYRFTVESTVYLKPNALRSGIGTALYSSLLKRLEGLGLHRVIGTIALPNAGSVKFHERMGFRASGRLPEVGRKFDRWIDVGLWLRELARVPE